MPGNFSGFTFPWHPADMASAPDPSVVALLSAGDVAADALRPAADLLREFGVRVVEMEGASPERAPTLPRVSIEGGWRAVIVASADGALPAAVADALPLPVIRVPVAGGTRSGLALLQTAGGDLPASEKEGASFATVAIGPAGAKNAALFVVSVLALEDDALREAWESFRAEQTAAVLQLPPPTLAEPPPAGP